VQGIGARLGEDQAVVLVDLDQAKPDELVKITLDVLHVCLRQLPVVHRPSLRSDLAHACAGRIVGLPSHVAPARHALLDARIYDF